MQGQIDELSVFGDDWDTPDGTAVRDFVHVSDLARGHVAAIVAETRTERRSGFHAVNLGTGTGSSVKEVVETMRKISGKEIRTKWWRGEKAMYVFVLRTQARRRRCLTGHR